jgi:DNA-binding beta-propeller fold protein YncE
MAKDMTARYRTSAALAVAATHASLGGVETPEPPAAAPTAPAPTEYSPPDPLPPPLPPEIRTSATAALPPSPAPRRRLPLVPIALVALLAVVALVAILVASGGEGKKETPVASEPRVVGQISTGGRLDGVVSNAGSLWIADNKGGAVIRMKSDGSQREAIRVGRNPYGMASNSTSVWVATAETDSVTRILPSTGQRQRFKVGPYPLFLTADEDVVYVANAVEPNDASIEGSVSRLDARTGQKMGDQIPVGKKPLSIVMGQGSVWVANRDSGTVSRITDGQPVQTIPVEGKPVGLLYHDGFVWVASTVANSVTRIDTRNNHPDTPTPVGHKPYALGYFGGSVWVTNREDHSIWRLDPNTGKQVGETIDVPGDPIGMTMHEGEVFVTSGGEGVVYRIEL